MEKIKITSLPLFSIEDLRSRWLLARVSAIENAIKMEKRDASLTIDRLVSFEMELLNNIYKIFPNKVSISADEQELILRKVFDNSRRLGMSLVKFLGYSFDLNDLTEVIPKLGTPCFSGKWRKHNQAYVLERKGCESISQFKSEAKQFFCNYWREAMDGLVMGLATEERLARHRSLGAGDDLCQDILFDESSQIKNQNGMKWGEIPHDVSEQLIYETSHFEKKGYSLFIHGYSEGKLFYEMKSKSLNQCGPGEEMMSRHFEIGMNRKFPKIKFAEISPKTVLDHKES